MPHPSQPSACTTERAAQIASTYFGKTASLSHLAGEFDATFSLKAAGAHLGVLKVSQSSQEALGFQVELLQWLSRQPLPFSLPQAVPGENGAYLQQLKEGGAAYLLTWVEGLPYAEAGLKEGRLLRSLGRSSGQLAKALQGFEHPGAERYLKWDMQHATWVKPHLEGAAEQQLYQYFESHTLPLFPHLRQSVAYLDANEHNIMVQPVRDEVGVHWSVCGFIDFGDAVKTFTVNDLAVALAYAVMGQSAPLSAAREVVKAFHEAFPLTEKEVAALPGLMVARLLISRAVARENLAERPGEAYLQVSQSGAEAAIAHLAQQPMALWHYAFREACGWEPCPQAQPFRKWLEGAKHNLRPVCSLPADWAALDLSVGSTRLGNNANFMAQQGFEHIISQMLSDAQTEFGLGGYGEPRPFYTTDAYEVEGLDGPRWRTVHLGLDIWGPEATPVYAPLDGTVHSYADNAADRDYGPTIILRHEPMPGLVFFTLYGHLSRPSLKGLYPGMAVRAGQQIATFGPWAENGGWPPHLHFQIMLDLLGKSGDFPGVGFPEEWGIYRSICPSPEPLAGLEEGSTQADTGQWATPVILEKRRAFTGPNLSTAYRAPLHMVRGFGHYLYDETGRRYLDTVNNVPHVGHQHPEVVAAVQRQAGILNTNTRYLHTGLVRYAEKLAAKLPQGLEVAYLTTSGSEANELALRMARTITGRRDVWAMDHAYHGHTQACIDISAYKFKGKGGGGQPLSTFLLAAFSEDVVQELSHLKHVSAPAAFISESILSCGGQLVPPPGYFQTVFEAVRAAGGLCIMDEVQTGFGRVGEAFWGFELQGVVPDIVVLGKPIANGFPMGAVVCTREVAEAFNNGMEFFSTFGGNPVACAAAEAVLKVIEDEGLQENARKIGAVLRKRLEEIQQKVPFISDVRGHGLFLGVELSRGGQPAPEAGSYAINEMRRLGVLMSTDGPAHNVLKIKPPLSFDEAAADRLCTYLEKVLCAYPY